MTPRQWTREEALCSLHEDLLDYTWFVQDELNDLDLEFLESGSVALDLLRNSELVSVRGEEQLEIMLVKELLEDSLRDYGNGKSKAKIISGYIIEGFDGKYFVTGINTEIFDDDRQEIALEVALGLRQLCYIDPGVLNALSCAVKTYPPVLPVHPDNPFTYSGGTDVVARDLTHIRAGENIALWLSGCGAAPGGG